MLYSVAKTFGNYSGMLLDLIFPPLCLHCHKLIPETTPIPNFCSDCVQQLIPPPPGYVENQVLGRLSPSYLEALYVGFQFNEIIQSMIHQLKYRKKPTLGISLTRLAARKIPCDWSVMEMPLILPIPLHPSRLIQRGYNQSQRIARGLGKIFNWEVNHRLIKRIRNTRTQTHLNREERIKNVQSAFRINPNFPIKRRHFIVVDDVVTTGATLNEVAKILKLQGAARVVGFALATPVKKTFSELPEFPA